MKILFLSSEVAPFAKIGGLGDVAGSLPKALHALGHDVRVVMPAYAPIEAGYPGIEPQPMTLNVPFSGGTRLAGYYQGTLPDSEVPIYFIGEWYLFNRQQVYGYHDDPYRFAFFSRAALDLIIAALDWRPDIVHAHDWHTAPAITWLATAGQTDARYRHIPTLFTIHNLAHQGRTTWSIFEQLGLLTDSLNEEAFDEVNFMARGIHHATLVNTVSPTYAREIMTLDGGGNLAHLLRRRQGDVHGILNGLDTVEWDPATDPRLPHHFDADSIAKRPTLKRELQARLGLPQRDDVPLLAMVTRLDWQKGLDITGHAIHLLMNGLVGDAQFVVLGTGDPAYESMFRNLADYHHDKMRAILSYNASFAPLIYAGSDMFLMPSLFEPCGLGQMIAMRYGSVPVVRETGGLKDTVFDSVTGFTFRHHTANDFWEAIRRAVYVYNVNKPHWRQIQEAGMRTDFSWTRSAHGYLELYAWAEARVKHHAGLG